MIEKPETCLACEFRERNCCAYDKLAQEKLEDKVFTPGENWFCARPMDCVLDYKKKKDV